MTTCAMIVREDLNVVVQSPQHKLAGQRVRDRAVFEKLAPLNRFEDRAFLTYGVADFYAHLGTSLSSSDRMTMRHSIELRVPFVENQMIDFGMHTPLKAKYHRGDGKRLLKEVGRRYLPSDITNAVKVGFGTNSNMWKGTGRILENGLVADWFKWDNGNRRRIQDMIAADNFMLFQMVSLELWARLFFDNADAHELADELRQYATHKV